MAIGDTKHRYAIHPIVIAKLMQNCGIAEKAEDIV